MAATDERDPSVPVTLRDLLRQEQLTDLEAMELGQALAESLVEAHRQGRFSVQLTDRKVLVLEGGRVQVAGLDGRQSGRRLEQGRLAPMYPAPEQWRDEEVGGATQVWALGLLLHQMIAGRHPYAEVDDEGQLCSVVSGQEPVPLGDSFDEVAPRLRSLVSGCLHKDPEQRPAAREVVKVLGELLESCRPSDPGASDRERKRTFRRLEQLEQQHAKPRRSVLGLLVGSMVVLILSAIHYRDLFRDEKKQDKKRWRTEPHKQPDGQRPAPKTAPKTWTVEHLQRDRGRVAADRGAAPRRKEPDAGAVDQQLAPGPTPPTAPAKNAPAQLYPTSTPEPATRPLPVSPRRR